MNKIALAAALTMALAAVSTEAKFKINAHKITKGIKKATKVAQTAQQLGLLDEDEADWEFNAGLSGQVGQKPNYQIGISGKWDEEEQGFGTKLNNALNTIDHAVNTAHSLGLMDEEEQKIKIGKALKKVVKVAVVASELGLLEEDEQQGLGKKINKILDKVDKVTTTAHRIKDTVDAIKSLEEDEADWQFNAGLSGQVGQKPNYQVGISGKWEEEEEEQKFKLGKALKKAAKVAVKANELGLLDEDEADWEFNAGLSGQFGGKPSFNVGITGRWEEEEQGLGHKLNNALNTIDHAVNTAHSLGLMDEEEQKVKIGKALKKVAKVAVKANELGLLEEDEQQGLGKKINKILDKVDKATATAHRIKDTVDAIKSLEEDGFLGGEGSIWINRPDNQIPREWLR